MIDKTLVFKRSVLSFLTVLLIGFIFYNSSLNADDSSVQSSGVLDFINNLFRANSIDFCFSENFVRKCAHFAEYFALGALLFFTVKSYVNKLDYKITLAFIIGLVTACVDESIQLFSKGRSCQLSDVVLDFFGVCTAVLIFCFIFKCVSKRKFKR